MRRAVDDHPQVRNVLTRVTASRAGRSFTCSLAADQPRRCSQRPHNTEPYFGELWLPLTDQGRATAQRGSRAAARPPGGRTAQQHAPAIVRSVRHFDITARPRRLLLKYPCPLSNTAQFAPEARRAEALPASICGALFPHCTIVPHPVRLLGVPPSHVAVLRCEVRYVQQRGGLRVKTATGVGFSPAAVARPPR